MHRALTTTQIERFPVRRGKVRDIYDLGDRLLLITTDRISAFDWVLPNGIPDKGRVLTQISAFWFDRLGRTESSDIERRAAIRPSVGYRPRAARRACDAGPKDKRRADRMCRSWLFSRLRLERIPDKAARSAAFDFPLGLRESDRLPEPIFTPATKEEAGHDINISFEQMAAKVGESVAKELRERSLRHLPAGRRVRAGQGHFNRRHEVRMGNG